MADTRASGGSPDLRPACPSELRQLERLEARRRMLPSEVRALVAQIRAAVAEEQAVHAGTGAPDTARHSATLAKWRLIHRYLHAQPFRDAALPKRSAQWRATAERIRDLGDAGLLDWVLLQVDVATNRERGIPDLRPRRDGPTFLILLEHVANAKRKTTALLKWAKAAEAEGELSCSASTLTPALATWHAESRGRTRGE